MIQSIESNELSPPLPQASTLTDTVDPDGFDWEKDLLAVETGAVLMTFDVHAEVVRDALPAAAPETPPPYEVFQQGPLTYFDYYFEDAVPESFPEIDSSLQNRPSPISMGLLGAGVLAATAVAGVVISDAIHQQPDATPKKTSTVSPSQDHQITQSARPQPTAPESDLSLLLKRLPQKTVSPERLTATAPLPAISSEPLQQPPSAGRLPVLSVPESLPPIPSGLPAESEGIGWQASNRQASLVASSPSNPLVPDNPVNTPEASSFANPDSTAATAVPSTAVPSAPITSESPSGRPTLSPDREAAVPSLENQSASISGSEVSVPASTPAGPESNSATNGWTQPASPMVPVQPARDSAVTNPALEELPSQLPQASRSSSVPSPVPFTESVAHPASSVVLPSAAPVVSDQPAKTSMAPGDRLREVSAPIPINPAVQTMASIAATPLPDEQSAASQDVAKGKEMAASSQALQQLLSLPVQQDPRGNPMPLSLTPQAATEAYRINQVGSFTVIRLNPRDYQQAWMTTQQPSQNRLPLYGFVDYRRQLVVLLQNQRDFYSAPSAISGQI